MHLEIVYIDDDEGGWEIEGEFWVNLPYYLCNPYIRQISRVYLSQIDTSRFIYSTRWSETRRQSDRLST